MGNVQQYDAFINKYNKQTFTINNVSKQVLGQHGIQLLLERKNFSFFPCVVGFLCIGTKVILPFLRINQAHYNDIVEKGAVKGTSKATVSYTRPCDYMDAADREDILEPLVWFGFVQSNVDKLKLS